MSDIEDYQSAFDKYASAFDRSVQIIAKMRNTSSSEQRAVLVQELKKWDAEQHKAIEQMERALGHH